MGRGWGVGGVPGGQNNNFRTCGQPTFFLPPPSIRQVLLAYLATPGLHKYIHTFIPQLKSGEAYVHTSKAGLHAGPGMATSTHTPKMA